MKTATEELWALFHAMWGDSKVQRAYVKSNWIELQSHINTAIYDMKSRAEKAEAALAKSERERDEAEADYSDLVGLLKKRFPPLPNGNLPDFAVEDVLTENARLREALGEIARGFGWQGRLAFKAMGIELDFDNATADQVNQALNPPAPAAKVEL